MPLSRRRKKKGKKVRGHAGVIKVDPNKESSVTLQDIINALAWEESKKPDSDPTKLVGPATVKVADMLEPGDVLAEDATVNYADDLPVTIIDENGEKKQIGTATPVPGRKHELSIHLDDEHRGLIDG